jgi:uncharacterized protein YrrD
MLNKTKLVHGFKLHCLDGEIGSVKEFYFDDKHWAIRYVVAESGDWLTGRQVLLSPYAITAINREDRTFSVNLTRKQIEDSPGLERHVPVSRQYEESYYKYYGWPLYWSGPYLWGANEALERDKNRWQSDQKPLAWDPHLRSSQDLKGHVIEALDGEIGKVEDLIFDEESWAIRYLVVDTRVLWSGKIVLISPLWIEQINWEKLKIAVNLKCSTIRNAPEYSESLLIDREYETRLYGHYNRTGYWLADNVRSSKHDPR